MIKKTHKTIKINKAVGVLILPLEIMVEKRVGMILHTILCIQYFAQNFKHSAFCTLFKID